MSQCLYFIFGPPAFEIELKTVISTQEIIHFIWELWLSENCWQFWRDLGKMLANSVRSLCLWKSRQDLSEILPRYRKSRTSWRDPSNRGEIFYISPQTRRDHGEISGISARWRKSVRDSETHINIMVWSRWDGGYLAAISSRLRISQTSRVRSLQSQRGLGNLGEMEDISPRSRRDLESHKHHSEISARSRQSRRDLVNLGEISSISARSRQSWRDLGKHFAREGPI